MFLTLLLPGHGRAAWHHTVIIPVLGLHGHNCFKTEMKRIDRSGVISFTEQMSLVALLQHGGMDICISYNADQETVTNIHPT